MFRGRCSEPDLMLEFRDWRAVARAKPDIARCERVLVEGGFRGLIITAWVGEGETSAPGNDGDGGDGGGEGVDFVSRFFAPNLGIEEDPATGSAHCALSVYWARERVGADVATSAEPNTHVARLRAKQLSKRVGNVLMDLERNAKGELVCKLTGQCVDFMDGIIYMEEPDFSIP